MTQFVYSLSSIDCNEVSMPQWSHCFYKYFVYFNSLKFLLMDLLNLFICINCETRFIQVYCEFSTVTIISAYFDVYYSMPVVKQVYDISWSKSYLKLWIICLYFLGSILGSLCTGNTSLLFFLLHVTFFLLLRVH